MHLSVVFASLLNAGAFDAPPNLEQEAPSPTAPPAVASEPLPASSQRRVLVVDLKALGVDANVAKTLSGIVANAVAREPSLAVTASDDLERIMGLQTDKQALGCEALSESCIAELAGALSADVVVSGTVGHLGDLLVVNLSIYDAAQQASVGREAVQAVDVAALSPLVSDAVDRMFGRATAPAPARLSPLVVPGAVVVGVGLLTAAVAGGVWGWSLAVQGDPKSLGADKTTAAGALTPAVAGVAIGAGTALAGTAILTVGLME